MQLGLVLDRDRGPARLGFAGDFACAWCRLAWHRLRQVTAPRGIGLCWLPFQIDPTLPPRGTGYRAWLTRRHGGAVAAEAGLQRIRAAAAAEQIPFDLAAIRLQPNTSAAHRLVAAAARSGRGTVVVDRIFQAFFSEGRDIGDPDVLDKIAAEAGVPADGGELPVIPLPVSAVGAVPVILDRHGDALVGCQPIESIAVFADLALGRAALAPASPARPLSGCA
ncbi:MAG TPA: DsbA family protein [Geminicoccus sp.]|uniref:DsbA family protein n=1 Tax=Geminicoccus sp. TaxID=2024832 RepID=UPI002CECCDE2|nr:DsbA family protein [Geminicoccus sp.]HWL70629.1 DsbA family protein [Geminicoccus sp.]